MSSRTFISQEQIQAEARAHSDQVAQRAAQRDAQTQALYNELAQRYHPELVRQHLALHQKRHELAADMQEARHQLAAFRQGDQDADEAFFRRGADLTFRAQWLEEQNAQLDQQIKTLGEQVAEAVARDAARDAAQWRTRYNTLIRSRSEDFKELERAKQAIMQKYATPLGEAEQRLIALGTLTPIDLAPGAGGLLRE